MAPDEWRTFGVPDGERYLDPDRSIRARSTPGGPSPTSVRTQADAIAASLAARSGAAPSEAPGASAGGRSR
jgi:hypothetical protein